MCFHRTYEGVPTVLFIRSKICTNKGERSDPKCSQNSFPFAGEHLFALNRCVSFRNALTRDSCVSPRLLQERREKRAASCASMGEFVGTVLGTCRVQNSGNRTTALYLSRLWREKHMVDGTQPACHAHVGAHRGCACVLPRKFSALTAPCASVWRPIRPQGQFFCKTASKVWHVPSVS